MYSRKIINIFLAGQVSGIVKNFNMGIFSGTITVINVRLSMIVLDIELYTFSDPDIILKSQQCQTVLTENFMFLSD